MMLKEDYRSTRLRQDSGEGKVPELANNWSINDNAAHARPVVAATGLDKTVHPALDPAHLAKITADIAASHDFAAQHAKYNKPGKHSFQPSYPLPPTSHHLQLHPLLLSLLSHLSPLSPTFTPPQKVLLQTHKPKKSHHITSHHLTCRYKPKPNPIQFKPTKYRLANTPLPAKQLLSPPWRITPTPSLWPASRSASRQS